MLDLLLPALHFCTEEQAEYLGLFFHYLFKNLNRWASEVNDDMGWNLEVSPEYFVEKIIPSVH